MNRKNTLVYCGCGVALLTEAEMIITNNLESTVYLSSSRNLCFLRASEDTKETLSPQTMKDNISFEPTMPAITSQKERLVYP